MAYGSLGCLGRQVSDGRGKINEIRCGSWLAFKQAGNIAKLARSAKLSYPYVGLLPHLPTHILDSSEPA